MPFTNAQLDADLSVMIADLPTTVTAGGESHSGTRSTLRRVDVLVDEGLHQNYEFSVHIRVVDWTTVPAVSTVVTIAGVQYIVLNYEDANAGRSRRLDLGQTSYIT